MHIAQSVLDVVTHVIAQVPQLDPIKGTAAAQHGAMQRLAEPTYYDFVFPVIAFTLVILLPTCTALWVIVRTLTDKKPEEDET
jgi:hypothetical protein